MDDFDTLRVPGTGKVAGNVGLLTGVFACVLAAQTLAVLRGPFQFPTASVMFALGAAMAHTGFRVSRGFGKSAVLALYLASVNILVTGSWFAFTLLRFMFSPLTFFVLMLSIVTVATSAVALPPLRKLDEARARLHAEGLDPGLSAPAVFGPVKMTRRSWAALAALCGIIGAVVVYRVSHRPFEPRSIKAVALLEQNLSEWTTAESGAKRETFARRLQSEQARQLLGAETADALALMLGKGAELTRAKPEEIAAKALDFTQSQSAVDGALARKGLPLFVDASLLPNALAVAPLIMTYYVEQDESFEYRGQPLRAVSAWRLDPMRVRLPALGYVREGNPVAIISYDLIEAELVLHLLPSLMEKEPAFVFDERSRFQGDADTLDIEARLGNVLRRQFNAAWVDVDTRLLGELLAKRRNLIAKWRRTITGFPITPPERLLPESDLGDKLETYISRTEAFAWQDISDGLSEARVVSAFERQRNELSGAIKRHELQHLIDQREGLAGVPVALARRLRVDASTEPEPYSLFGAARSELSAYMAQVADGLHPRLSLVQLSAAVFDRNLRGQPHHFAALALFDGLMKSLRVIEDHPTYDEAVVRVIEAEPAAVQAAARNLYEEWFGRVLTSATRTKIIERAHWRH